MGETDEASARDGLDVRIAGVGDIDALATLIGGFRDHLEIDKPSDADLDRHLPRVLEDPNTEFACAWLWGRAVGYTQMRFFDSIWELGTEAHLEDIFVEPVARGVAVGRALMEHATLRARARDAKRLGLVTNSKNENAHALYRAAGLEPEPNDLYPGGQEVFWVAELVST